MVNGTVILNIKNFVFPQNTKLIRLIHQYVPKFFPKFVLRYKVTGPLITRNIRVLVHCMKFRSIREYKYVRL